MNNNRKTKKQLIEELELLSKNNGKLLLENLQYRIQFSQIELNRKLSEFLFNVDTPLTNKSSKSGAMK